MLPLPSNRATRLGFNILMLLAAGIALRLCQSVFVPTIIALLLACVLAPWALLLQQRLRIRWALACITVIFGLIVVSTVITVALFGSVFAQVRQLDVKQISSGIEELRKKATQVVPFEIPEGPSEDAIRTFVNNTAPGIFQSAGRLGLEWLFLWFFILFLLFFMLIEGPTLVRRVVDIFGPSDELKAKASKVLLETAEQIRTYIVWRTIINFFLALLMGAVFSWGELQQPWIWAFLLFVLNYIPYLGPVAASIPPLLDAFVNTPSFGWLFGLCVLYWTIIILEGYLVVPLVMGRSMDLNAVTVMLACLFWELVWGMTGLFLAMPIMAGVKSVCQNVPGWWQWANLMSADEIPPPLEIPPPPPNLLGPDGSPNGTPPSR
jgi:predicted PurR-regulated permease PerM